MTLGIDEKPKQKHQKASIPMRVMGEDALLRVYNRNNGFYWAQTK